MNTTSLYWVFYDAQCGLCQRARVFLQQWSRHPDAICFLDIHEEASQAILRDYGVSIENALGAMHAVEVKSHRVFVAEKAVGAALCQCAMPWAFVGWILQQPVFDFLTRPVYRWVAVRRHRFLPPLPVKQEATSSCERSCRPF
jgi:predicted DCC family thiol-disulfide oxidoreductase YuxK